MPSQDMTKGIIERLAYAFILMMMMKLVQWGYIPADDAPYYAGGILAAAGSLRAYILNRPSALAQSAANIPREILAAQPETAMLVAQAASNIPNPSAHDGKTVVVTNPVIANAMPENNVQASTVVTITRKAA